MAKELYEKWDEVSIHTPTQGVTLWLQIVTRTTRFQSTHPRRVWRYWLVKTSRLAVSIHTPTQGVTARRHMTATLNMFQSTHPRRVWRLPCKDVHQRLAFQSTHPRRVWPYIFPLRLILIHVSIHTPTQGVTKVTLKGEDAVGVSIHTPTQGVTLYLITYYKSANLIHCYANHHYYSTS